MEIVSQVRKGVWMKEEDVLLRDCIERWGEGDWHLVPRRAGLNRCRKSCRLRWLNYLKPDINREKFQEDEVDMMRRLHKLLGNRWTLIAGRLPGRTANDVKNYWYTHVLRQSPPQKETFMDSVSIIRPRPHKISRRQSHQEQRVVNDRDRPPEHKFGEKCLEGEIIQQKGSTDGNIDVSGIYSPIWSHQLDIGEAAVDPYLPEYLEDKSFDLDSFWEL